MFERPARLGDTVDDYCSKCRLLMDHAVQALDGEKISTVVCNTCQNSHSYRHGKVAKKRKPAGESLFDQILAKKPPTRVVGMPNTKKPSGGGDEG